VASGPGPRLGTVTVTRTQPGTVSGPLGHWQLAVESARAIEGRVAPGAGRGHGAGALASLSEPERQSGLLQGAEPPELSLIPGLITIEPQCQRTLYRRASDYKWP
jgi:hypothetical protein